MKQFKGDNFMSNIFVTIKEWRKKGRRYFLNFLVKLRPQLYPEIENFLKKEFFLYFDMN